LRSQKAERLQKQALLDEVQIKDAQWRWDESLGFGRVTLKMSVANGSPQSLRSIQISPGPAAAQEAGPDVFALPHSPGASGWSVDLTPPLAPGKARQVVLALNPYAAQTPLTAAQEDEIKAKGGVPQDFQTLNAIAVDGAKLAPDFTLADQTRMNQLEIERNRQKNLDLALAKPPESK